MVRLRAGEPFPVRKEPRRRFLVGRKKASVRVSSGAHKKKRKGSGSSEPAMPPPPPSAARVRPESAAAAGVVAVEDTDALDCGVCFLPLKPPIFQCNRGHVVCSPCHDKLKATGKCHVCSVATCGYSRCHAMERLVESIRVQCPNAAHGCTARPAYYDQHWHRQTCSYTPCQCPSEACDFVGSMDSLLDHFDGLHGWSCPIAAINDDNTFDARLHDGFNFFAANRITDDKEEGHSSQCLILMNVARQPFGCTISVLCMHTHGVATAGDQGPSLKELRCELWYSHRGGGKLIEHDQKSKFIAECTSLSNGLPKPDDSFQFLVPNSVLADGDTIQVGGRMILS